MASPESLLFRAVKGILASVPGGQGPYIGRRTDYEAHAAKETDLEKLNPFTTEENCAFGKGNDAPTLSALRKMARDGDIAPADAVTAEWCGLAPVAAPAPPAPVVEPATPPPVTSTFQQTTSTRSDRAPRT